MIGRYTRPEMGRIWELENKFAIWKEIEVLACEAQAELGQAGITREEAQWIRDHADFTVEEIDEIEKVTNHDVIAFTTCMAGYIDADIPEPGSVLIGARLFCEMLRRMPGGIVTVEADRKSVV